jgi:hypothetical protein
MSTIDDMEICIIDKSTGFLYEWSMGRTVNVYTADAYGYARARGLIPRNCIDHYGYDVWTISCDHEPTIQDFMDSVFNHLMSED